MKRIFTVLLVIFAILMTSCEYLDKYLGDFMNDYEPDEFAWVHAVLPNTEEITKIELTEDYPAEVTDMCVVDGFYAVRAEVDSHTDKLVVVSIIDNEGKIVTTKAIKCSDLSIYSEKVFEMAQGHSGAYAGQTLRHFNECIVTEATTTSTAYANAVRAALTAYKVYNTNLTGAHSNIYYLSVVADDGIGRLNRNKVTSTALALVTDEYGVIVAARVDSVDVKINAPEGEIDAVERFTTKVEYGDSYIGMPSGSWADQAEAFENWIVGKTVDEVAALQFVVDGADAGLIAGCTMKSSLPILQTLVKLAAAYERRVEFTLNDNQPIELGLNISASLESSHSVYTGKIYADYAAVVTSNEKVVAAMIDSADVKITYEYNEYSSLMYNVSLHYLGTKNEQGDNYNMMSFSSALAEWYVQAQNYANTTVGKTISELEHLSTDPIEGSCTIKSDTFKSALILAAKSAREF